MKIIPLTLKQANAFVVRYHRHNNATVGCKFAIGATKNDVLIGVAIAGRPIARHSDDGVTLEILRACTDGTKNANSFLYSKIKTIGFMMGYKKIITFTLKTESQSSLKAVGAKLISEIKPGDWNSKNRIRCFNPASNQLKLKWEL